MQKAHLVAAVLDGGWPRMCRALHAGTSLLDPPQFIARDVVDRCCVVHDMADKQFLEYGEALVLGPVSHICEEARLGDLECELLARVDVQGDQPVELRP